MLKYRFKTLIFIVLLLISATLSAQQRDPMQYFFHPLFGDLSEERITATDENKKAIMLMFEEDDCPFCARMKKTVLNQVAVQDYFRKNFHILLIDKEQTDEFIDFKGNSTTMKDFAEKEHRVRATPVFLFFDLEGNKLKRGRFTGAAASIDEFMALGRYYAEGFNNKTSFRNFKKVLKESQAR